MIASALRLRLDDEVYSLKAGGYLLRWPNTGRSLHLETLDAGRWGAGGRSALPERPHELR